MPASDKFTPIRHRMKGKGFVAFNKRMNRLYKQRYSDKVNNIVDLTSQQMKEAFIVSQQYLSTKIKYNYLSQSAKAIQLVMLLDYAQYVYLKTTKEVNFTSDFTDLIASVQRFMIKLIVS